MKLLTLFINKMKSFENIKAKELQNEFIRLQLNTFIRKFIKKEKMKKGKNSYKRQ